jgi:hypothetical protein
MLATSWSSRNPPLGDSRRSFGGDVQGASATVWWWGREERHRRASKSPEEFSETLVDKGF